MSEVNISQKFRLKTIDKTRHYFIEEMNQNELKSKKQKKVCATFNYIENLLILASVVTGCFLISDFASLVGIPIGVLSSVIELKICAITAGVTKYKRR